MFEDGVADSCHDAVDPNSPGDFENAPIDC